MLDGQPIDWDRVEVPVATGAAHGRRVDVDGVGARRAERDRRDREDAGPATDVGHRGARCGVAASEERLQRLQTERRRRVGPVSEAGAGIDADDTARRARGERRPRRHDEEQCSNLQDGPSFLHRLGDRERAHRPPGHCRRRDPAVARVGTSEKNAAPK